jgi:hypothetical protein
MEKSDRKQIITVSLTLTILIATSTSRFITEDKDSAFLASIVFLYGMDIVFLAFYFIYIQIQSKQSFFTKILDSLLLVNIFLTNLSLFSLLIYSTYPDTQKYIDVPISYLITINTILGISIGVGAFADAFYFIKLKWIRRKRIKIFHEPENKLLSSFPSSQVKKKKKRI